MFSSFASGRAFSLAAGLLLGASALVSEPPAALAAKPAKGGAKKAAKQPIAVGQITGPQGPKVRSRVLSVLKASAAYEITDAEDLKPTDKPATFANTARMLGVDAIVVGTVTKKMTLLLTVYDADGKKVDTVELPGGTFPKLFKSVDNELEIAIAEPIADAKGDNGGGAKAAGAAAGTAAAAPAAASEDDSDIQMTEGEPPPEPKSQKPKDEKKKAKAAKGAAASAAAEPQEEEEEEEVETPAAAEGAEEGDVEDTTPAKKGRRPLEAIAGVRAYNRKFNYTDSTDPDLHSYSLDVAPALLLSVRAYPGAWFRDDFLSHIGLQFRYEFGIPTTTQYPTLMNTVAELKTKAGEWEFGLRGRFPILTHELGFSLSYGAHWFKLKGDETFGGDPYAVVPDVDYRYIRPAIEGRLQLSKLVVGAHVAPRFVVSLDELDLERVWFPAATGSGLDLGVMGGWRILKWLDVVLGLDVVRYGFDFNPVPTDNRVIAGGATDTYLSLWVGAMFHLDPAADPGGASVSAASE